MRNRLQPAAFNSSLGRFLLISFATFVLAIFIACSETDPTPTPDIDATVDAKIAAAVATVPVTPSVTPDIVGTVTTAIDATIAAQPTATNTPTSTPTATPTPTPTPSPTATPEPTATPTPTPTPTATPTPSPTPIRGVEDVVSAVESGVVRIQAGDKFGSGFIYKVDFLGRALVMTNQHVVTNRSTVTVRVNNERNYSGLILGTDAARDLAVIRICCDENFTVLPIGDSSTQPKGSTVLVMGYPLAVEDTARVTTGVVSAVYFDTDTSRHMIQTDAAINSGNSGGPLFNLVGEVIGVNTEVIRVSGSGVAVDGTGFAVAQETFEPFLPTLENGG